MATRKISVFLLVIAFHLVVMGIVYFVTEGEKPTITDKDKTETPPKNNVDPINNVKPPTPPDNNVNNNNNSTNNNSYVFHTVAKGEFLSKIAEKYKVSPQEVMTVNNIKDPNKIILGQKLKIPVK